MYGMSLRLRAYVSKTKIDIFKKQLKEATICHAYKRNISK